MIITLCSKNRNDRSDLRGAPYPFHIWTKQGSILSPSSTKRPIKHTVSKLSCMNFMSMTSHQCTQKMVLHVRAVWTSLSTSMRLRTGESRLELPHLLPVLPILKVPKPPRHQRKPTVFVLLGRHALDNHDQNATLQGNGRCAGLGRTLFTNDAFHYFLLHDFISHWSGSGS